MGTDDRPEQMIDADMRGLLAPRRVIPIGRSDVEVRPSTILSEAVNDFAERGGFEAIVQENAALAEADARIRPAGIRNGAEPSRDVERDRTESR